MLVLTWNLFHGRSVPDTPHSLLDEFAATLAGWVWDVALLQEVPPWWPAALGRAAEASARTALTSRNQLLPLRRAIAQRRPDLIKSNGGGANAILVRTAAIEEHRVHVLRRWPERRVVHAVRLDSGVWIANLHAQAHSEQHARSDLAAAGRQTLAWAGDAPAVLGGDANLRDPVLDGFTSAGGHSVDHVLARDLTASRPARTLDRATLSDHLPLLVDLASGKDQATQASKEG